MIEDEMVGWHHRLSGHEFEQTLGDSGGQGSLMCCSPWGHTDSDTTQPLNNNYFIISTNRNHYITHLKLKCYMSVLSPLLKIQVAVTTEYFNMPDTV